jgi:hypothetical protein
MSGVGFASFYRTNLGAFGTIVSPNALSAFIGVDFIDCVTLTDCLIRTFALTSSTTDTILGNFERHNFLLD